MYVNTQQQWREKPALKENHVTKSVKVIAAFCGLAAIGILAVRSCGGTGSSTAPDTLVLHSSEKARDQRAGSGTGMGQPSGWIAKSGGVPSERGHDAAAPQAARRGSGDSLSGTSTAGSRSNAGQSKEAAADDPIRVQPAVPAAPVHPIGNEGTQTGVNENVPRQEAASNSGDTSSDSPTPPEDSSVPTPARRGSFFASMNFGVDSETVFPEPDSDFSPISINDNAGTISFCLQPQWSAGGNFPLISSPAGAADRLSVTKDGQYLRFALAGSTGIASTAAANINAWRPGERHLVTTTWGKGQTLLYVDGKLVDQQTFQGQLQGQLQLGPDSPLHIGSSDVPDAGGSLSQLQIQDRVMSESDIGDLASGCQ